MKLSLENLRSLVKEVYQKESTSTLLEAPRVLTEQERIDEAINKLKHPFKAIFILGPAGAGKTFFSKQIGVPKEFETSNPDEKIEKEFGKFGLSLKFATKEEDLDTFEKQQTFREKLQNATQSQTFNWLNQAKPIVFDTTGEDVMKMGVRMEELKTAGYDIGVIMINVPTDVSVETDKKRARTVGKPTKDISLQYQDEVKKDRGYFTLLTGKTDGYEFMDVLGDDIYGNFFNLSNGELRTDIPLTQAHVDASRNKDGVPYTPEYATQLLGKIKGDLKSLLGPSKNPKGAKLVEGMRALVKASGGYLGNRLSDFAIATVAEDKDYLSNPKILEAAQIVMDMGGAEGMFKNAQKKQKVAGKKLGKAVQGDDGKMRDPTARELGTPKQYNEEELHEQVKEMVRNILLTKDK
jgi:shikimate kinase